MCCLSPYLNERCVRKRYINRNDRQKIDFNLPNAFVQIKAHTENLGYFNVYRSTFLFRCIILRQRDHIKLILKARCTILTRLFLRSSSGDKN